MKISVLCNKTKVKQSSNAIQMTNYCKEMGNYKIQMESNKMYRKL